MRLGVLTGLKSEASIAARLFPGAAIRCACSDPIRADLAAAELAAGGATHLLSFGIAGALAADLRPGQIVLGSVTVAEDGGRFASDTTMLQRLAERLPEARVGHILAARGIVGRPEEKTALNRMTGAIAVDMESGALARVAAARALPFAVVRAIADPADRALPDFAPKCVGPDGGIAIGAVIAEIVLRPSRWGAARQLGRDSAAAHASLKRLLGRFGGGGRLML